MSPSRWFRTSAPVVTPKTVSAAGHYGKVPAEVLKVFSPATATWFREVFARPTAAQVGAWRAISAGQNALVVAPTGSGKTLAAFLWALDDLTRSPQPEAKERCRVLYVSPLKALAVDVERNLRAPLAGITQTALRLDQAPPNVTVGVRSGDTTTAERRSIATRPPDILITTPESLFLMLTSSARDVLRSVRTVIVDEVHALAGTKRGAHLALSLERLEALTAESATPEFPHRPLQRIGLSATVRPAERVAAYLGGPHPVQLVTPKAEKSWDLEIVVPVEDMSDLGSSASSPGVTLEDEQVPTRPPSIWPHVENKILDLIEDHRSTIVFANSRRLAERLTAHLNDLHADRLGQPAAEEAAAGPPAQVMAQSGSSSGQDGTHGPVIARAHHGSVSKEQRAQIESDLKSGLLPCVVATSSLELGIDMGAVDVVVQVESPPSVASGLQRVGRAGHQVGATSRGVFFPNHRGDLIESSVVVERMRRGAIEEVADLRNPLDVLAQQVVAVVSGQETKVDELYALVRRASSFRDLPYSAFEAVLDMLSGRYPSEDFAELRPRLVWQRDTGLLTARPGAQRLAVTSGGTIPDRGLFGVFIVGEGNAAGKHAPGRRVGELDEEMVYETRVGDVFTLGTTSWRVEQITHDQVLVSPAPGVPGRLPFWKGDSPGRPLELGRAFGGFVRELATMPTDRATARLRESGLDDFAARNLLAYLSEQSSAAGALPTDQTIVFERFRDELGDWRVCVHSALGTGVLTPWALAVERAARERYGLEVHATATNDGMVLRIPDTESEPPSADLIILDPDTIETVVTDEVGGSALFAARFRECAARALLLPRRDPKSRSPLWQQRMRSAQLLTVAAQFPEFPIVLETMRECLTDVFDLDGLLAVQREIAARSIRLVEVETKEPSPFAKSLLFGYVGAFVYEGDVPLAEKKAAALSLDATLLAELLGKDGLKQLLDASVIARTEADLQGLSSERQVTTAEQLYDLIRTAGPFSRPELALRCGEGFGSEPALEQLLLDRRLVEVRIAGVPMVAVAEDVPRLRDGLGIPVPPGVAASFGEPSPRPIEDLVLRWARTHGPFVAPTVAARYGLGRSVVEQACDALVAAGTVVSGSFVDLEGAAGDERRQYCHGQVLSLIKRRTLALLRKEVEPVEQVAYARFLPEWQGVGSGARGSEAVLGTLEQLAGYAMPASAVESVILPARVADYTPAMLDELTASGEVTWVGDGGIGDSDGWVRWYVAGAEPAPLRTAPAHHRSQELLDALAGGGAYFFDALLPVGSLADRADYVAALWDLVWSGLVTGDTFAPVRALAGGGAHKRAPSRPAARTHRARLAGGGLGRPGRAPRILSPSTAGRWSLVQRVQTTPAERLASDIFAQLDRYGVVSRGSVMTENGEGGFGAAYRALSTLEESGQCRRGYFIEGLGAAQFALGGAVDRLRSYQREPERPQAVVLAACDPANAYGAALPWPEREGHRPGRKAGALVVLVDGALVFYVERGGKTLLSFTEDPRRLGPAATVLAGAVRRGQLGKLSVERADGGHVFGSTLVSEALQAAGFRMTPQGLRLRPSV
ncbi:MAG: Probable ATP-dependent helicase lhr [uncultured Friedmanniella sp.]|uniref:Probable ATP-dependent helicase lhr n=1 Tax=uncultured Friedmanniella sp. TaxID=335381 RepID=A0A6J4KBG2_9ACTN|nr:MAG: Probable ATP-dependent helicase lhr [uncultured Friedmanniella sp.]